MSFDTAWLALREPADHAARDPGLLAAAAESLRGIADAEILDLGCGTGSTMRALLPRLARPVRWRLIDNDPALLAEAEHRAPAGIALSLEAADLADPGQLSLPAAGMVTASALFDLVSHAVAAEFVERVCRNGLGFYAALNFDGEIDWQSSDPDDAMIVAAFNRHQSGDKGFGPALGRAAAEVLTTELQARGYRVATAQSPWRIGADTPALHRAFLDGMVAAVEETREIEPDVLRGWTERRHAAISAGVTCRVGHLDVLALPA